MKSYHMTFDFQELGIHAVIVLARTEDSAKKKAVKRMREIMAPKLSKLGLSLKDVDIDENDIVAIEDDAVL